MTVVLPDEPWRRSMRRRLLAWYRRSARDLPWRQTSDPYLVWISEIMLQQTQVATVVPYFHRFVAAFPSLRCLAEAGEQDVLRHWEGLGYYRRARQLHRAAKEIVARHDGRFPDRLDEAMALPGVGRYTAGAILSIAFDRKLPIVEANTIRLYSRLLGYEGDVRSSEGQRLLWSFAEAVLPHRNTGAVNQALMELGAEVCRPRSPDCAACPLTELCAAARAGKQATIPSSPPKTKYEEVTEHAAAVFRRSTVALRRRPDNERWAGLWDFPRLTMETADERALGRSVALEVQRRLSLTVDDVTPLTTIKHPVTKYRITLHVYRSRAVSGRLRCMQKAETKWFSLSQLDELPLSTPARRIAAELARRANSK